MDHTGTTEERSEYGQEGMVVGSVFSRVCGRKKEQRERTVLSGGAHHLASSTRMIPQKRTDVVNLAVVSLPAVLHRVVHCEFFGMNPSKFSHSTLDVEADQRVGTLLATSPHTAKET
jgi:predicted Na+-dependent transporter